MNFPFFIARRYILSKKSTNAINLISAISVIGVAVAATALVVVLSVFNGFRDLVASHLTNFDPQLKIEAVVGKTLVSDDPKLQKVKEMEEVDVATETIEEMAMAVYNDKQLMTTIKGVDDSFAELTHITECIYGRGEFSLHAGAIEYAVVGSRAAMALGCDSHWQDYMRIYAPTREGQLDMSDVSSGFVVDSLMLPSYVFAVGQGKYDKSYVLAPISFARRLFDMQGEMTSLELRLKEGADINNTKHRIRELLGEGYSVKDRFEQQADTFRIMQVEKVLAYVFLTFILIIACFNIIGSISMLIIDKKRDVEILRNLGASDKQIARIFLFEGRMITAAGALIGIVVGLLLCLVQQQYGIVKMGSSADYIVNAYPVSVHYTDVLIIFITVLLVGWTAVWYPVRSMSKRLLSE